MFQHEHLNFAIFCLNSTAFQEVAKLLKLNQFLKRSPRSILKTTALLHSSPCYQKLLKGLFMTKQRSFRVRTISSTGFNQVFEKTTLQTLHLTHKITTGFKQGYFTGMILINLQKAFDTIDHQILLKKMKYLGFSKNTTTWFKSNLCQRKFKISINTSYSSPSNLLCDVPQGSICSSLLFILQINNFPQAVVCNSLLYADDT